MSIFSKVGGLKPGLTAFNLSHTNLFDCGFGQLIPVACLETLPGDVFKLDADVVGRLTSALKSPILSEMDIVLEAFYTPTRLLMGKDANFDTPVGEVTFEEFLSGGRDGSHIGSNSYPLPTIKGAVDHGFIQPGFATCSVGDYLGIQVNTNIEGVNLPIAFPWRAYRWIWNEFYRDENLMDELQVCQYVGTGNTGDSSFISVPDYDSILYRCWRKDYFTSALPFQQRGTSPALPISGFLPVTYSGDASNNYLSGKISFGTSSSINPPFDLRGTNPTSQGGATVWDVSATSTSSGSSVSPLSYAKVKDLNFGSSVGVNLSDAATFDVNQIRTAFQVQKWLERNARGGVRYTEYLRSHFGVAPSDARLQRPQFIGSIKSPWIVSEVLQTSETNTSVTPQGNQAGQAINLSRGRLGNFRSYEYGYIMILCSVVPKALYQQGLPRWMSRKTNLDFYSPEFAHLSEQAVKNKEIFYSYDSQIDEATFGFQPIWNELRFIPSRVSGHMKTGATGYSFDYWHFGRSFASVPALDETFLSIGKSSSSKAELMRVFAVQDENPFIINVGFRITALRPMPYLAEPGLIDHF